MRGGERWTHNTPNSKSKSYSFRVHICLTVSVRVLMLFLSLLFFSFTRFYCNFLQIADDINNSFRKTFSFGICFFVDFIFIFFLDCLIWNFVLAGGVFAVFFLHFFRLLFESFHNSHPHAHKIQEIEPKMFTLNWKENRIVCTFNTKPLLLPLTQNCISIFKSFVFFCWNTTYIQ